MQMHSSLVLAFDATGCSHSVLLVGGNVWGTTKTQLQKGITTKTKTNSMTGPPPVLVVWGKVFEDLPSPAWSILGDSWPTFHCLRATILQFIFEFLSFLCSRCILLHISTSIFQFPSDNFSAACMPPPPPPGQEAATAVAGWEDPPSTVQSIQVPISPPHYCMIWVLSIQWPMHLNKDIGTWGKIRFT